LRPGRLARRAPRRVRPAADRGRALSARGRLSAAGPVVQTMSERVAEERPDSLGALRALGGVGGHLGAPHVTVVQTMSERVAEECPDSLAALRGWGGVAGERGAPHVTGVLPVRAPAVEARADLSGPPRRLGA